MGRLVQSRIHGSSRSMAGKIVSMSVLLPAVKVEGNFLDASVVQVQGTGVLDMAARDIVQSLPIEVEQHLGPLTEAEHLELHEDRDEGFFDPSNCEHDGGN